MSTRTPPAVDGEPGGPTPTHTVFLSYSRADRKGALAIVRVLESAGYGVWWDGLLEGGERFSRTTEAALAGARAVVVLWSKTSAGSHWVHDEATRGRESGRLVPLSLDGSLPPLGFGQFQSIDVSHALGKPASEPMRKLLRAVAALHEGPAPAWPAPRAELASPTRRRIVAAAGLAVVAAGSGLLLWRARDAGTAARGTDAAGGDPSHRGAAVREPQRRSRAALFFRWPDLGNPHPAVAQCAAADRRADLVHQGPRRAGRRRAMSPARSAWISCSAATCRRPAAG
jgi:hypothetical protein